MLLIRHAGLARRAVMTDCLLLVAVVSYLSHASAHLEPL